MRVEGPYCKVYPKILPQTLIEAITRGQIEAAKYEFARIKREESRGLNLASKWCAASKEWRKVRIKVLEMYGRVCMKCGSKDQIQVDHIKPKSKYPALALEVSNLQVLCWPCNKEKSYLHETDYRPVA